MLRPLSTVILFTVFCRCYVEGLTCYSCTYTRTGHPTPGGDTCIEEPWNVTTSNKVICTRPEDICITKGVYFKEVKGFNSFLRGCGSFAKSCTEDVYFITCFTNCPSELCNSKKLSIPGVADGSGRLNGCAWSITMAGIVVMMTVTMAGQ